MSTVSIKNVVIAFDLGRPLNCVLTAMILRARFDSGVFPAVVSYCKETCTSAQIFGTGRAVIVGCKSNDHGLNAAHLLVHTLFVMMDIDFSVLNFHISNTVCRLSLYFKINLDLLFNDITTLEDVVLDDENGTGGPQLDFERFPGMTFDLMDKQTNSTITVAIFNTGNGVGTGIKYPHQMEILRHFLDDNMTRYKLGFEYRQLDPKFARTLKHNENMNQRLSFSNNEVAANGTPMHLDGTYKKTLHPILTESDVPSGHRIPMHIWLPKLMEARLMRNTP